MKAQLPIIVASMLTLTASVVGYVAERLIQSFLNRRGTLKIYRKIVYSKILEGTWGFYEASDGMSFTVPLWIEIQNTKDITEIVRNLNLSLYKDGKFLTKMKQINHINTNQYYGDSGNYSFIISPKSITKYELHFALKKHGFDESFDEVRLSYFDSRDVEQIFKLEEISNCWKIQENQIDEDWKLVQ